MSKYIYPMPDFTKSIYAGQTWTAYKPGQDAVYKDAFVSRHPNGDIGSVVNKRSELIANAKLLQIKLKWVEPSSPAPNRF